MLMCIYIYAYAVESKFGPKITIFESNVGPNFFVFQKSFSFCREN